MEERYQATTQNRFFFPDMSNVNKNITVEAKLINPPTYISIPAKQIWWKMQADLSDPDVPLMMFKNLLTHTKY